VVAKGWTLLELRRDAQTLEDVFRDLTKGDERRDRKLGARADDRDEDDDRPTERPGEPPMAAAGGG
jgi:ABC-2 type transport system ATP-binding protein